MSAAENLETLYGATLEERKRHVDSDLEQFFGGLASVSTFQLPDYLLERMHIGETRKHFLSLLENALNAYFVEQELKEPTMDYALERVKEGIKQNEEKLSGSMKLAGYAAYMITSGDTDRDRMREIIRSVSGDMYALKQLYEGWTLVMNLEKDPIVDLSRGLRADLEEICATAV